MNLAVGQTYKKSDFGIDKSSFRLSEIIVGGELYMFFSLVGRYKNIIQPDGFIYECRCGCSVIPEGKKAKLQPYVFVRMAIRDDYTYLGRGAYEMRYNNKCNKVFFKEHK